MRTFHEYNILQYRQLNEPARYAPMLDIMKEYRRLDDTITMRLNRNNAQWRDKDRMAGAAGIPSSVASDAACESFWQELVGALSGVLRLLSKLIK